MTGRLSISYQWWASLMAQQVKNLPAMQETQETWVQSLGREEALEEEMATHSSILAWTFLSHGQRSLAGYSPWCPKESDRTEGIVYVHTHIVPMVISLFELLYYNYVRS